MNHHRRNTMPVEEYRVPPGQIALTFDFEGYSPGTIAISGAEFSDIVATIGNACAGWSYDKTLSLLGGVFREWKKGRKDAECGLLLGYWIALNHPVSGDDTRRLIANRMANNEPIHITLFGARKRGIAIAVGDRFVDLEAHLRAAKAAGIGVCWQRNLPKRKEAVQ